jgi:hypothetical protein
MLTLSVYFIGDDFTHLGTSENLSWTTILQSFVSGESGTFLRPIGYLSIFLDHSIWGTDPFGYHITNLALHFISVFGVFFLICEFRVSKARSLVVAGIFAALPIQVEAVTWMGARFDLLALALSLWSFVGYYFSHRTGKQWIFAASLVLYVFAVLTKESAYVLPLLIAGSEFLILRRVNWSVSIYFVLAGLLGVYRFVVLGRVGGYTQGGHESFLDINLKTLEGLVVRGPAQLFFGFNWSEPPVAFVTVISSLTISFLLLLVWYSRPSSSDDRRLIIFGLAWTFFAMLPVHFLLLIPADANGSRVLYMPSVGIAILLGILIVNTGASSVRNFLWIVLVISFDLGVINNIRAWRWTGQVTESVFPQIRNRYPDPPPNTVFVIKGMPKTERGVFLFNVGLNQMVQLGFGRSDVFAARENELDVLPNIERQDQIPLTWDVSANRFAP